MIAVLGFHNVKQMHWRRSVGAFLVPTLLLDGGQFVRKLAPH